MVNFETHCTKGICLERYHFLYCIQIFYRKTRFGISWKNVQCVGVFQVTYSTNLFLKSFLQYFNHQGDIVFCLTYDCSSKKLQDMRLSCRKQWHFSFCVNTKGKAFITVVVKRENLSYVFSTVKFFSFLLSFKKYYETSPNPVHIMCSKCIFSS